MKAIKSFILLILLASSSLTFSQGNIFPEGRKWIIREYKINPTVNYNNIITCLVSGDTILAGHSYKKVHFTNHATNDTDVSMLIRRDGSKIYQRYGSYGKWNPDTLVFDESWQKGDKTTLPFGHNADGTISSYAEIFETGQIEGRKYWNINDSYTWVQDVGYITTRLFFDAYGINYGGSLYDVICCVEANGDTLYVNRDILHFIQTDINNLSADNISITPADGGCLVTLDTDTGEWTATLYNSNGVTVAQQQGNGNEAFLSTDSKGTHILVVKAGGRVVKKKIMLR